MLELETISEKFTAIHKKRLWSSKESISGTGSTLENTNELRSILPSLVDDYKIKEIVDSPCGDFNWFKEIIMDLDVSYFGVDIVEDLIEENSKCYSGEKVSFQVGNICEDNLPTGDLLIVRDCLFHLSHSDINRFLINILNLDYRFLLTSSFELNDDFENSDIISGGFRFIDITKKPYCFDENKILKKIDDDKNKGNKKLLMFHKNDVPHKLNL